MCKARRARPVDRLVTISDAVVAPQVAAWLPLGIIPISIWLRPGRGRRTT